MEIGSIGEALGGGVVGACAVAAVTYLRARMAAQTDMARIDLDRDRDAGRLVVEVYEGRIDDYRASRAELRQDLDTARAEIAQREAVIAELREHVAKCDRELAEMRGRLDAIEAWRRESGED